MAPLLPLPPDPLEPTTADAARLAALDHRFRDPYILIAPASIVVLLPAIIVMQQWGRNNATWAAAITITIGWTLLMRRLSVNLTLRLTIKRREWLRGTSPTPVGLTHGRTALPTHLPGAG